MKTNKAYKVELNPNNKQKTFFLKNAGAARFAYNWGLAEKQRIYKEEKNNVNYIYLDKKINKLKKTTYPWMYDVSKCSIQCSLRNLDQAFIRFFKKQSKFPRLKKRKDANQKFTLYGSIHVIKNKIKLPRIGWVRLKEECYVPTEKEKIKFATISTQGNKWFVSVLIEEEIIPQPNLEGEIIGIDLGVKALATCSNGMIFENPKALKKNQEKLSRLNKQFSRKKKGSNNRNKARTKLSKQHYKIACVRKDAISQLTTALVKTKPKAIVIEDLNVVGMLKNHKLAGAISDASFYEIKRQLEYKSLWNGIESIKVDRFFPSSKTCSNCGWKNENLKLSDRTFKCQQCGFEIDRDFNASLNLQKEGLRILAKNTVGLTGINACGDESSGFGQIVQDETIVSEARSIQSEIFGVSYAKQI